MGQAWGKAEGLGPGRVAARQAKQLHSLQLLFMQLRPAVPVLQSSQRRLSPAHHTIAASDMPEYLSCTRVTNMCVHTWYLAQGSLAG